MIMRDMDRASTMNPTMVDMGNTPHWVDRPVWTETLAAAGAVAIARRGRVTARLITTITTITTRAMTTSVASPADQEQ